MYERSFQNIQNPNMKSKRIIAVLLSTLFVIMSPLSILEINAQNTYKGLWRYDQMIYLYGLSQQELQTIATDASNRHIDKMIDYVRNYSYPNAKVLQRVQLPLWTIKEHQCANLYSIDLNNDNVYDKILLTTTAGTYIEAWPHIRVDMFGVYNVEDEERTIQAECYKRAWYCISPDSSTVLNVKCDLSKLFFPIDSCTRTLKYNKNDFLENILRIAK